MHLRGTATVPADQARRPITARTLSTLSIEAADKVAATGAQLRLAEHRRKRSHVGRRLARVLKMFGIEGMLLDRLREGNSTLVERESGKPGFAKACTWSPRTQH